MKKKTTKIFNLIMNIFTYAFLTISLILLFCTITSKKDNDGATNLFGYQIRIVISESMAKSDKTYSTIKKYQIKSIPVKSIVLIKTIHDNKIKQESFYNKIKIGDANVTLTGKKIYEISYNYNIGKDPVKEADEFYYNIIA